MLIALKCTYQSICMHITSTNPMYGLITNLDKTVGMQCKEMNSKNIVYI